MAEILRNHRTLLVLTVFFVTMSLTTLAGFLVTGEVWALLFAAVFSACATFMKYKIKYDTSGFASFSVSLAADCHLLPACALALTKGIGGTVMLSTAAGDPIATAAYGLAVGGTVANIISVFYLVHTTTEK